MANPTLTRLLKMAQQYPHLQAELLPVIQQEHPGRVAAVLRKAFNTESEQFVAWCLMKKEDIFTASECQRVLDKIDVPFVEATTATRGPLAKGEMVRVDATKNANPKNTDVCARRNEQVGSVTDVDGDALVVEFGTEKERFEGTPSGKDTGLYRYPPPGAGGSDRRALVEVVYIRDKNAKPDPKRIEQVQEYVDKGVTKGESRAKVYYTGLCLKQGMGKNGYYFTVFPQQREMDVTSFNPGKGQVLYLGVIGHRPGGWKQEFAKMLVEAEAAGDSAK